MNTKTACNLLLLVMLLCFQGCNSGGEQIKQTSDSTVIPPINRLPQQQDSNKYAKVDMSPMDMSYYPADYPLLKMNHEQNSPDPIMRVIYSRPHLQGRRLFHDILKYGTPWRLGANEATELDVYKPVLVNNKKITPGRYTMYCIPGENNWDIAISGVTDIWGLKIDSSKDVLRTSVPVIRNNQTLEYFTMAFENAGDGANLIMAWGDVIIKLPFTVVHK